MKQWVARISLIALEADGEAAGTHEIGFSVSGKGSSVVPLNTAMEHARWYLESSGFKCDELTINPKEQDMTNWALENCS